MAYALTRATLGRLGAHSVAPIANVSTAFVGADWTVGAGITAGVLGGRLRIHAPGAGVSALAIYTAVAARADMYVQAVVATIGTGQRLGVGVRVDPTSLNSFANLLELSIPTGFSSTAYLREMSGGVQQQSDGFASQNIPVPEGFKLLVEGTEGSGRIRDPGYHFTLSGLVLAGLGYAGVIYSSGSGNNSSNWDSFYLMASHKVTVNGPAGTWRADILNGVGAVIATAAPVAGVATIDMDAAGVTFPDAVKLEIRDTGTDELLVDISPVERIWGGDVYTFEGDLSGSLELGGLTVTAAVDVVVTEAEADLELAGVTVTGAVSYVPPPPPFTELSLVVPNVDLLDPIAFRPMADGLIIRPQTAPLKMRSLLPALPARTQ